MENGCPFGDREARKVELFKGGRRDRRNVRPTVDFIRSDPPRFAELPVRIDVGKLQCKERQCQSIKLGFQKRFTFLKRAKYLVQPHLGNPDQLAESRVENSK